MATFTFSVNSKTNKKTTKDISKNKVEVSKNIKVELVHHDKVNHEPEYYSYINNEGEKCKYSGIISRDLDGSYIGKTITTHKVILTYHPTVKTVEHVNEYFSYIDNNGIERVFSGSPEFDLDTNTYFGKVTEYILNDETIDIFKEDK